MEPTGVERHRPQPEGRAIGKIADAGHAMFIDQPNALPREIEIFLQGGWPKNSKEVEKS